MCSLPSLLKSVPISDYAARLRSGFAGNDLRLAFPASSTNRLAIVAPKHDRGSAGTEVLIEFDGRSAGAVFTDPLNGDQGPTFEVKVPKGARARTR